MKPLSLLMLMLTAVYAESYFAKVEPVTRYTIKSNVSGAVVYANQNLEGKYLSKKAIIEIDSAIDRHELRLLNTKVKDYKELVALNKEIYTKKLNYYNNIKELESKSSVEKDNAYYAQASAKIQYLTTKSQYLDMLQRKETLTKTVKDKSIKAPNMLVTKLYVKEGDFVNMGSVLLDVEDTSKAKLTVFISKEDALRYRQMKIIVDGANVKSSTVKVWSVADKEHLSLYKAEIIIPAPKLFSKLAKVTFTSGNE